MKNKKIIILLLSFSLIAFNTKANNATSHDRRKDGLVASGVLFNAAAAYKLTGGIWRLPFSIPIILLGNTLIIYSNELIKKADNTQMPSLNIEKVIEFKNKWIQKFKNIKEELTKTEDDE